MHIADEDGNGTLEWDEFFALFQARAHTPYLRPVREKGAWGQGRMGTSALLSSRHARTRHICAH
eukprot:6094469-Prymnesium_polylepis.2